MKNSCLIEYFSPRWIFQSKPQCLIITHAQNEEEKCYNLSAFFERNRPPNRFLCKCEDFARAGDSSNIFLYLSSHLDSSIPFSWKFQCRLAIIEQLPNKGAQEYFGFPVLCFVVIAVPHSNGTETWQLKTYFGFGWAVDQDLALVLCYQRNLLIIELLEKGGFCLWSDASGCLQKSVGRHWFWGFLPPRVLFYNSLTAYFTLLPMLGDTIRNASHSKTKFLHQNLRIRHSLSGLSGLLTFQYLCWKLRIFVSTAE